MSNFNSIQFCDTCSEWVECDCETDLDAGFTYDWSAHLIATRSLVCPECGNALKTQTAKHYIDLDWKD